MSLVATSLRNKSPYWYLVIIGLLFPLIYFKLFFAEFISWDDTEYLLENKDVQSFNVYQFFTTSYVGNYHPITMLNFAIDWLFFGTKSVGYHTENLIWHFINTCLVFVFVNRLLASPLKALLVTVVFAFHPQQLENVAWVAERKTLLCGFFMLMALIMYVRFISSQRIVYAYGCFILFLLAILSKSSAVVFPVLLVLLDFFYGRINKKSLLQKFPFFIVAIAFGVINIMAQQSGKFINESHEFTIHERIGYAGYALVNYLSHFFIPTKLSVIYPYPQAKLSSMFIGYSTWIVLVISVYFLVKNKKQSGVFGLLFFVVNLLLVLQFIPFGEVLTADRYMYLPIIGVGIIVVSLLNIKEKTLRYLSLITLVTLGSFSFLRAQVWQNSIELYSDILKNYPNSYTALNSLGAEYMLHQQPEKGLNYLNKAILISPNYYKGYYNRGLLFAQQANYNAALADFNKAIELKNYIKAYVARANVYYTLRDYPKVMNDIDVVISQEPTHIKAHYLRATCYDDLNQLQKALEEYTSVITLDANEPLFLMRRAIVYGKLQNYTACIADLDKCIHLDSTMAQAYYWRGVAKGNNRQNPCDDLKQALLLGFNDAEVMARKYCQ